MSVDVSAMQALLEQLPPGYRSVSVTNTSPEDGTLITLTLGVGAPDDADGRE